MRDDTGINAGHLGIESKGDALRHQARTIFAPADPFGSYINHTRSIHDPSLTNGLREISNSRALRTTDLGRRMNPERRPAGFVQEDHEGRNAGKCRCNNG